VSSTPASLSLSMPADDTRTLKIIYGHTFSLANLLNFQKSVGSLIGTRLSRNSSICANRRQNVTLHFFAVSLGSCSSSACVQMSSKRSHSRWPSKCLVQLQHVILLSEWATLFSSAGDVCGDNRTCLSAELIKFYSKSVMSLIRIKWDIHIHGYIYDVA